MSAISMAARKRNVAVFVSVRVPRTESLLRRAHILHDFANLYAGTRHLLLNNRGEWGRLRGRLEGHLLCAIRPA